MIDLTAHKTYPITLMIKVTTKAKREFIKEEVSPDGSFTYKVYVTAAPEDGKANKAVISLLAKTLGIAKSRISIKQGESSRHKVIEISG